MSTGALKIRPAIAADVASLLAIYRRSWSPPRSRSRRRADAGRIRRPIAKALGGWQWLLAERAGQCIGYAYGSAHRERRAYRWSVEVFRLCASGSSPAGRGRTLYERLLEDLACKGFCNAYAGITMPNEASIALHRSLGFESIGVFKAVGRKFGKWHDVAWFQRSLRSSPSAGGALATSRRMKG